MFKHRVFTVLAFFLLCLIVLGQTWPVPLSQGLQAGADKASNARWKTDLSGKWENYRTLSQAWQGENGAPVNIEQQLLAWGKEQGNAVDVPSNGKFNVIARDFTIGSSWSARVVTLVLDGLQGKVAVYLNGIDDEHCVGQVSGNGISNTLNIASPYLKYGAKNQLFIRAMDGGRLSGLSLGDSDQVGILGSLYLEAVPQTVLDQPRIGVTWEGTTAHLTVSTGLLHYSLMDQGPWNVQAVLSDGSAGVAQQSIQVKADGRERQDVEITLDIPEAKGWTPADPYLYQLNLTAAGSQGSVDNLGLSIGLSNVATANGQLLMQGQGVKIKGVALPEDKEQALRSKGQIESWLKTEKGKGINLVYFLDQFPDELWLQAADRLGMGVWAEFPNRLTLAADLPDLQDDAAYVQTGSRHPCLWGWVIGRGVLGDGGQLTAYMAKAQEFVKPLPAYLLLDHLPPGAGGDGAVLLQGNKITGNWGEVDLLSDGVRAGNWQGEQVAAISWAVLMVFLSFANLRAMGWRYKEINEVKPKRKLRQSWRWCRLALIGRLGTLGGVMTSVLYDLPHSLGPWFKPNPLLSDITAQSPWFIWTALTLLLLVLRWMQIGVAAPFLPGKPNPMGLSYWLERRYLWIGIIPFLWIATTGWILPAYLPLAAYGILSLLFFPVRVRDIHKAGGKYSGLTLVPLVISVFVLIWNLGARADWYYLYLFFRS